MTAEDIDKSIRDRIAEIDAQIAPLLDERMKLSRMLGVFAPAPAAPSKPFAIDGISIGTTASIGPTLTYG